MNALRRTERFLVRVEEALLVLFLGAMVILAFLQVVLRNVFSTGFLWADPLVRHCVLWSGFLGGALATSAERHINVDALTRFLSPRLRSAAQVVTGLFAAVACAYLARAGWTFLASEHEAGSTTVLGLPVWAAAAVIPAGYALMTFHFLLRVMDGAASAVRPEQTETPG